MRISAAILAGGTASRMGRIRKEMMPFAGSTLLGRMLSELRPVFDEIIIVSNEPAAIYHDYDVSRVIPDIFPGKGPLAGIHAALANCRDTVFVFACDQPLLNTAFILTQIRQLHARQDALIPRHAEGIEPLHGIYATSCLAAAETVLSTEDRPSVRKMLSMVNTCYWDIPKNKSFANINTPEDMTEWEQRVLIH